MAATSGLAGTTDGNSVSTGGNLSHGEGENLPEEVGASDPVRLETKGRGGGQTVSLISSGMVVQGPKPYPDPSEGYTPAERLWSGVDRQTVSAVLSSLKSNRLGFQHAVGHVIFVDSDGGEIVRLRRADGDRFRKLMEDDDFRDLLSRNFDRALELALNRFPDFGG